MTILDSVSTPLVLEFELSHSHWTACTGKGKSAVLNLGRPRRTRFHGRRVVSTIPEEDNKSKNRASSHYRVVNTWRGTLI